MDAIIARYNSRQDADLMVCEEYGVAYQKDMSANRVPYDSSYLAKVDSYDGTEIARAVNAGRCAMLSRHLPKGAKILDVGAGSGAFVRDALAAGFAAKGFDVIKEAAERLVSRGEWASDPREADGVTLWDAIEHIDTPSTVLANIRIDGMLFTSVPVFKTLSTIRESKHYRPGEHLYYWTMPGFVRWLWLHGFKFVEFSLHEVEAGREDIGAFAFVKYPPAEGKTMKDCVAKFDNLNFMFRDEKFSGHGMNFSGEPNRRIKYSSCECGGERQLESFTPIKRPEEWFLRCRDCGALSQVSGSAAEVKSKYAIR